MQLCDELRIPIDVPTQRINVDVLLLSSRMMQHCAASDLSCPMLCCAPLCTLHLSPEAPFSLGRPLTGHRLVLTCVTRHSREERLSSVGAGATTKCRAHANRDRCVRERRAELGCDPCVDRHPRSAGSAANGRRRKVGSNAYSERHAECFGDSRPRRWEVHAEQLHLCVF